MVGAICSAMLSACSSAHASGFIKTRGAVDLQRRDRGGNLAVVAAHTLMLGGAALDAARKAQRGHSGGIVRLLLSAASRAADPLPGVQVARLIERDDEAREVGVCSSPWRRKWAMFSRPYCGPAIPSNGPASPAARRGVA